jgi:two-component system response regulator AtoC
VDHFVQKFCRQYNREVPALSPATIRMLHEYAWPGNVRELENVVKRAVVLQSESLIQEEIALRSQRVPVPRPEAQSAPALSPHSHEADLGLKEIAKRAALTAERTVIKEVLERVRWNRAEAARVLKISYKAMLYKIRQVGLDTRREARGGRK